MITMIRLMRGHPVRRGQALTEMAIALPILFLFIFGLIELGLMIKTKMVLQDAVRSAVRFGMLDGNDSGSTTGTAAGCEADYAVLDNIQSRLSGSLVDTSRVRSIFIYAATSSGADSSSATSGGDDPTVAPSTTLISGSTFTPPYPGKLYGDYYYSDYNLSDGTNVDPSTTSPATAQHTGTGQGAIYRLFHSQIDQIFSTAAASKTVYADTGNDGDGGLTDSDGDGTAYTIPACGSTLLSTSSKIYDDSQHNGGNTIAGPSYLASTSIDNTVGNWPPQLRNNQRDFPQGLPDSFGVDIVYDYQFHTPIFQVIANVFLGGTHSFRMDERSSDYMSPQ